MKSNYLKAIEWIDEQLRINEQLKNPIIELKIPGETIHDLNFSLKLNQKHILMDAGQLSYSAFCRTKRIKDFLENKN
jgi:hypothetical protein